MKTKSVRLTETAHGLLTVLAEKHSMPMNKLVEALAQATWEEEGDFGIVDLDWDLVRKEFPSQQQTPQQIIKICQEGLEKGMTSEEIQEAFDLSKSQVECLGTDIGAKALLKTIRRRRLYKEDNASTLNKNVRFLVKQSGYSSTFCRRVLRTAVGQLKVPQVWEGLNWPL